MERVGTRNVSVSVAGLININDTSLPNSPLVTLRCRAGFHGATQQFCAPCPVGAICDGGLARPRSQHGWWRLNTTRFVRCLPSHACLGNNTCASGYGGDMCNTCGAGHYRSQQDCDICSGESSATFVFSIVVIIMFVVVVLLLTKYDFKLASVTALVDFMQTVAILGYLPLSWPNSMRWMFKVASVFIFNFQMAAPECYDKTFNYASQWYLIQGLPIIIATVLFFCFCADRFLACCRNCCRRKEVRVIHVNKVTPAALVALKLLRNTKRARMEAGRSKGEHLKSVGGAGSILVLYLYFALLSTAIQVHMCAYLDDELSVLIAEPSEPCHVLWNLAGVQHSYYMKETFYPVLYPLSILSIIAYGVGIPAFYHYVFWHKREKITLDLWRRAQGKDVEGATWRAIPAAMKIQKIYRAHKLRHASGLGAYFVKKNPTKIAYIDVRRLFGKVYEDFSPDHASWRLVQLWRKILVAAAAVTFAHNPSLSAGLISCILVLAFALHMHVKPFMYSRHVFSTEHKTDHDVRNKNVAKASEEQRKIRAMAQYHAEHHLKDKRASHKALKQKQKEESMAAQLKELADSVPVIHKAKEHSSKFIDLLLDYNSLEAMNLLFCALLLNIGIMFDGLRYLDTNVDGFSFLGVEFAVSGTSEMTRKWNAYFVYVLETLAWIMFVLMFVLCVSSVLIDITRNMLYHTFDTLRVHKIMRIHKQQQKSALKIFKQNNLDIQEETAMLKHAMGQLQDDQAKHLQLQTKEFERKKNNIERGLASAALEKLRLNQKLRKMKKKQMSIIGAGGGDLPMMPDISVLNDNDEIDRAMQEYDSLLQGRADPAAQAARQRLQRRLQLRQHQLKKHELDQHLNEQLTDFEAKHANETAKLMLEIAQADVEEDKAVSGMSLDDAERMLQRLENEAQTSDDDDGKMSLGRERLKRKLEKRQREKMLREKAALASSTADVEEQARIQRNLDAELEALENQSEINRLHFQSQFEADQARQADRMRERLRKKNQKKMGKLFKSQEKLEKLVQRDNAAVANGMGDGDITEMLAIQTQIDVLANQAKTGQDELDALIEENAADSRMLLNQTLSQQAGAHSKLERKLLERKRKRKEREILGDAVSGHVDVTEIGGIRTSMEALKHRNALKDATARLDEARQHVATVREHVAMKKGVPGVKEERNKRIEIEEREAVAQGMAKLAAQQAIQRRQAELALEADIERAKLQAVSEAHLEVEMDAIMKQHKKDQAAAELHLALDKQKHKKLLEDRLRRRRKTRQAEHEIHMDNVAVATPVDLALDLKYAEVQVNDAQDRADGIMLNFVASQKAMAEVRVFFFLFSFFFFSIFFFSIFYFSIFYFLSFFFISFLASLLFHLQSNMFLLCSSSCCSSSSSSSFIIYFLSQELERETELHHSRLQRSLAKRKAHRQRAGHDKGKNLPPVPSLPSNMSPDIQAAISQLDTSLSGDQQAAALMAKLGKLVASSGSKSSETRKANDA